MWRPTDPDPLAAALAGSLAVALAACSLGACGSSEELAPPEVTLTPETPTPESPAPETPAPESPAPSPAPAPAPVAAEVPTEAPAELPPLTTADPSRERPHELDLEVPDPVVRRRIQQLFYEAEQSLVAEFEALHEDALSGLGCEVRFAQDGLVSGVCTAYRWSDGDRGGVESRSEVLHYRIEGRRILPLSVSEVFDVGEPFARRLRQICEREELASEGCDAGFGFDYVLGEEELGILVDYGGEREDGIAWAVPYSELAPFIRRGNPVRRALHLPEGTAPAAAPGAARAAPPEGLLPLSELLFRDAGASAAEGSAWVRTRDAVTLREEPSAQSAPLLILPKGTLALLSRDPDAEGGRPPVGPREPRGSWVEISPFGARGGYVSARLLSPHVGCLPSPEGLLRGLPEAERPEARAHLLRALVRVRRVGALEDAAALATTSGGRSHLALYSLDARCALGPERLRVSQPGALRALRLVPTEAERGRTALALASYEGGFLRWSLYSLGEPEAGWSRRWWEGRGLAEAPTIAVSIPAPAGDRYFPLSVSGGGFPTVRVEWAEGRFRERGLGAEAEP